MTLATSTTGQQALRRGRHSAPCHAYLVTTVCMGRQRWFSDHIIAGTVGKKLIDSELWGDAERLCWVLMPDHLHLLIRLAEDRSLPRLMQRIKAMTSLTANRAMGKQGRLWMPGYHDRALRADECLHDVARYIAWNPVRAGLVQTPDRYPFWGAIWQGIAENPG